MAYNFPIGYQPYQPQYQMQQQTGIIWIQGEQAAKSYLTAPNTTVALWDSETQRIYLKSTDASGMPSIKTLEYTVVEPQNGVRNVLNNANDKVIDYATKTDLNGIYERLAALERRQHESALLADAESNDTEISTVPQSIQRRSQNANSANVKQRQN